MYLVFECKQSYTHNVKNDIAKYLFLLWSSIVIEEKDSYNAGNILHCLSNK